MKTRKPYSDSLRSPRYEFLNHLIYISQSGYVHVDGVCKMKVSRGALPHLQKSGVVRSTLNLQLIERGHICLPAE